ncbi:MAG TPA: DUF3089 domain-containing protein [Xanthomonadales bacterium]|nr:DUF3089 domain-containing protein [Xanthomonadales bacterium]
MKLLAKILIGLVLLAAIIAGGLYAAGYGPTMRLAWIVMFHSPEAPFDPATAVAAPDYADKANWAALPEREGLEDRLPDGVVADYAQGEAPVDVFFVHPTGYLIGNSWTSPMAPGSKTAENTRWMMANQASAYNGCCNVYAPRYREANVFVYVQRDKSITQQVLDFAYQDVARAFEYFIKEFNQGRPFIIASHSQGTHHAVRLLNEQVDPSAELRDRMVAAYVIGGRVNQKAIDSMEHIPVCDSATQTGCAVHWDTFSEGAIDEEMPDYAGGVCVNPLSWRADGERVGREQHAGGVLPVGVYYKDLVGEDIAEPVDIEPLGEPVSGLVEAQCKGGVLFVTDLAGTGFVMKDLLSPYRYHSIDYPLFHMDIRENAAQRTRAFLDQRGATEGW